MPVTYNEYDRGQLVRLASVYQNSAGADADPTNVFLDVRTPAGVTTTYQYGVDAEIVKDSTGNYHADISATASGPWRYRWYATGAAGQASDIHTFYVLIDLIG